jgi:hypothetical protein
MINDQISDKDENQNNLNFNNLDNRINKGHILNSSEKNLFKITNKNGVISAKKVNQKDEVELLVYDTNKDINIKNSKEQSNHQNEYQNRVINSNNNQNPININLNSKESQEKSKLFNDKNIDFLKIIYGDNKNNSSINISTNSNNNINFINLNEISKIDNKSNFSCERLNSVNDDSILNDLPLMNKQNNTYPNKTLNNDQILVSEFHIENLNLIKIDNLCSKNQFNKFQNKGRINNVEEIVDYIEHNADEVYDLVKNLNEDQPMEIEIFEDDRTEKSNNNDSNFNNNIYENNINYHFIDEGINNLGSKDIFNVSKINTHLLRSKVQFDKSNKLHYDEIESRKPRLKKLMKNFINDNLK